MNFINRQKFQVCECSESFIMIFKGFRITYSEKLSSVLSPIHTGDAHIVQAFLVFLLKLSFALYFIF